MKNHIECRRTYRSLCGSCSWGRSEAAPECLKEIVPTALVFLFVIGLFGLFGAGLFFGRASVAALYGIHKAFAQSFRKGEQFAATVINQVKRGFFFEWFIGIAQAVPLLFPVRSIDELIANVDTAF